MKHAAKWANYPRNSGLKKKIRYIQNILRLGGGEKDEISKEENIRVSEHHLDVRSNIGFIYMVICFLLQERNDLFYV